MKIEIDVISENLLLLKESLLGDLEQNVEVPGEVLIESYTMQLHESFGPTDIFILVASFLDSNILSVSVNLFSNWLYEKLKKSGAKKVRIEHREVRIEIEEIEWAVGEAIKSTRTIHSRKETITTEE